MKFLYEWKNRNKNKNLSGGSISLTANIYQCSYISLPLFSLAFWI